MDLLILAVNALLRLLGGSSAAQDGAGLALYRLGCRYLGKWATLFWATGIHWGGPIYRLIWVGLWTLVQDIPEGERYGWRRLWGWSIVWNFD